MDYLTKIEEVLHLKHNIKSYSISRENHIDNTKHLHCFLELDRKLDTKNSRYFDVTAVGQDDEEVVYHGNYQGAKNKIASIQYTCKDITDMTDQSQIIMSKDILLFVESNGNVMN